MRFLTTLLMVTCICTGLLVGAAFWIDAPGRVMPSTGLTAATILGTDEPASVVDLPRSIQATVASAAHITTVASDDLKLAPSSLPQD